MLLSKNLVGGVKMKKILFATLTLGLIYILSIGVFAAPQELDPTYDGTAQIITVTNPVDNITTLNRHIVVTATADEGVIVTLYTYDPDTKKYELYKDAYGNDSWRIGASGLFIKRIPVIDGINYVGVFAEQNGFDQFIKRRVDRNRTLKTIIIDKVEDVMGTINTD